MGKFPSFSQRKGLKPLSKQIQIESIDTELKNNLWNALSLSYWNYMKHDSNPSRYAIAMREGIETLFSLLVIHYFRIPIDTMSPDWIPRYKYLREYFFKCEWHEVYSLIEFIANNFPTSYPLEKTNKEFMEYCNHFFEMEFSAYRFVGGVITQITSKEEIAEIEEALEKDFLKPVHAHLDTALKHLSDRKSPDFRNSIKESISAVEAICKLIAKKPNATLTDALGEIKKQGKIVLHPALESAFDKLYGYTSDKKGIRHSLIDIPDTKYEDAKFMLVSCSAFINYLILKASEARINLK